MGNSGPTNASTSHANYTKLEIPSVPAGEREKLIKKNREA